MSIGIERLTGNTHLAYPFQDDSPSLDPYPWLKACIADAYVEVDPSLTHPIDGNLSDLPAYISAFSLDATTLTLIGAIGTVGLQMTLSLYDITSSPYTVLISSNVADGIQYACVKLVIHNGNALELFNTAAYYGAYIFSTHVPFAYSVRNTIPRGLVDLHGDADGSVTVNEFGPPTFSNYPYKQPFVLTERVRLAAGYNIGITSQAVTPGDRTELTLSAVPGAGLGRIACGTFGSIASVKLPAGLQPDDNGNVQLESAEGCYTFQFFQGTGRILVANDCEPCCSCDDYQSVLAALQGLTDRFDAMKTTALHAYTQYQGGVTDYNGHATSYRSQQLTLTGLRGPDYKVPAVLGQVRRGSPNQARWVMVLSNNTARGSSPVRVLSLDIAVTAPAGSRRDAFVVEYRTTSGAMTYSTPIQSGLPVIYLAPGESISVTMLTSVPLASWAGTWTATGTAVLLTSTGEKHLTAQAVLT